MVFESRRKSCKYFNRTNGFLDFFHQIPVGNRLARLFQWRQRYGYRHFGWWLHVETHWDTQWFQFISHWGWCILLMDSIFRIIFEYDNDVKLKNFGKILNANNIVKNNPDEFIKNEQNIITWWYQQQTEIKYDNCNPIRWRSINFFIRNKKYHQ